MAKFLSNDGLLYLLQQIYIDITAAAATGETTTIATTITSSSTNSDAAGALAVYNFVTAAIADSTHFSAQVVQTLPTSSIQTNVLYLVPKATSGTDDVYDEYLYINNSWEHVGSTVMDLSGYWLKADLVAMTNTEIAAVITSAKG